MMKTKRQPQSTEGQGRVPTRTLRGSPQGVNRGRRQTQERGPVETMKTDFSQERVVSELCWEASEAGTTLTSWGLWLVAAGAPVYRDAAGSKRSFESNASFSLSFTSPSSFSHLPGWWNIQVPVAVGPGGIGGHTEV